MKKEFAYKDVDGDHFPDGEVGDSLEYGIDFSCYIEQAHSRLITPAAVWTLPKGLVQVGIPFIFDHVAFITIQPEYPGSFTIKLQIHTEEDVNGVSTSNPVREIKTFKRILKVR